MESFVRNLEDRPKGSIKDFIYVIDKSLTKTFCNNVIKKFNNDSRKKEGVVGHGESNRVDKNAKNTKDIPISVSSGWEKEDKIFYSSLKKGLDQYNQYLFDINDGICNSFPNATFITNDTGYKVQMYEPGGTYHWHHDWSMSINPVASRIFTFMWYLNTIKEEDEGYTEFADGTKVQPVAGRLIFFPATWTYIHRGYPPKVRKYLCNGWIHSFPPS
tara:strand:- start:429 stop:1076 length:648 start_codon:yes stop_codon:yes gene_type:complete